MSLTVLNQIVHLVTLSSRYLIILLMVIYTVQSYTVFARSHVGKRNVFLRQNISMFFIHFISFLVMFLNQWNPQIAFLYGAQFLYLMITLLLWCLLYPRSSRLLINNMLMLITIGFIMITRLSFDSSVRQFEIVAAGTVIALLIPVIVRKVMVLTRMTWAYTFVGIGLLGLVLVAARVTNGAKLSLSVGGFAFQPSEFVKIIFVFAVAGLLSYAGQDMKKILLASALAALHVLILVISKDLGSALIFFITYLVMLFACTRNPFLVLIGLLSGCVAAVGAYFLFSHVRIRVQVWQNPFSDYSGSGYQISQSLFSIASGRWLGTGLGKGSPGAIPFVQQDMMFSAITEELGAIFSICLILVCMSCYIMIINIAMKLSNRFYRMVALGLGTTYAVQVFLTIGGGMKLIPLTGVTLPLVSYGGSSALSTIAMFAIVQGLYMLRRDEEIRDEERRRPKQGTYPGEGSYPEQTGGYLGGYENGGYYR